MSKAKVQQSPGGVVFPAKIVPGSGRTQICGLLGGMVKFKVSAPAEKGRANNALLKYLAKKLGVKFRDIRIESGRASAVKRIAVDGLTAEELTGRLGLK